ncbi:MAG: hypothetical protein AAF629_32580, partial [Chloroflexota bacterium]
PGSFDVGSKDRRPGEFELFGPPDGLGGILVHADMDKGDFGVRNDLRFVFLHQLWSVFVAGRSPRCAEDQHVILGSAVEFPGNVVLAVEDLGLAEELLAELLLFESVNDGGRISLVAVSSDLGSISPTPQSAIFVSSAISFE